MVYALYTTRQSAHHCTFDGRDCLDALSSKTPISDRLLDNFGNPMEGNKNAYAWARKTCSSTRPRPSHYPKDVSTSFSPPCNYSRFGLDFASLRKCDTEEHAKYPNQKYWAFWITYQPQLFSKNPPIFMFV